MNNRLLKEIQEYHYSLRDANGMWRKNPIGFIYDAKTSDENIRTVKYILNIILDSDNISAETKIFIANKGITIRSVNEIVNIARSSKATSNSEVLKSVSYNNTCAKLQEDNDALELYLGNRVLRDIVYDMVEDKDRTAKRLMKFSDRFGDSTNYRNNIDLNIHTVKPKVTHFEDSEEFFDILRSIEPYLVQRKEIIERALNSNADFVNYFNYLLSKLAIDDAKVQRDRLRLIRFLKNENYDNCEDEERETEIVESMVDKDIPKSDILDNKVIQVSKEGNIRLDNYTVYNYDKKSEDVSKDESDDLEDEFTMRIDT